MLILAFDTATERATSALVRDGNVLEQDFARLPDLLGREAVPEPELPSVEALVAPEPAVQLGLF